MHEPTKWNGNGADAPDEDRLDRVEARVDVIDGVLLRIESKQDKALAILDKLDRRLDDNDRKDAVRRERQRSMNDRTEMRLVELEGDVEETGKQSIEAIKQRSAALESSATYWRRYVIGVLIGVVSTALLGSLGYLIVNLISHH